MADTGAGTAEFAIEDHSTAQNLATALRETTLSDQSIAHSNRPIRERDLEFEEAVSKEEQNKKLVLDLPISLTNTLQPAHIEDAVKSEAILSDLHTIVIAPKKSARKGNRQKKVLSHSENPITIQPAMNPARLFIASLGNPPPYSTTRHSAGHIVLKSLQSYLQLPPFQKSRAFANGLTSLGAESGYAQYTLWQSPSLMNVSGVALLKAYQTFASSVQNTPADPLPGLVILYDEMETAPSQLRLRRGTSSARGHNGLKSVQQSLQSAGLMTKLGDRYVKIGIGIGRPAGGTRSSDDVSQYVLGQFTGKEKQALDGKIEELVGLLQGEMMRMSK